ncbi:Enoyl-CoA hydratase/carnithine racemase [Pseudomonas pohangensis]|uniref:Enoyl-CoA hydratase/carnithine racemase n=1 Tax=Pseudomonas pohangensis TaxID=364197 RepID=A0A1H2FN31_9PSED|nr:enoyl-CoA hydratase/isomerase family protein [Pseudomonas pohangensis]SDU08732.1 Enoyl-CoA hydratase/carnithine racemase [Pseudomonas pohangensis]
MIKSDIQDGVARITLNQPDRANALGPALVEALIDGIDEAVAENVHTLVLAGEGKSFCGGLDLSRLAEESDADLAHRLLRIEVLLQKVYRAPCYTVALTHGTISGAGADLAAACIRRVAAERTRFRFPGIRFGVVLGTRRLVELVGARGYRIILEQEMLNAEDALNTGLITDIIEAEAWAALVEDIGSRIGALPGHAVKRVALVGRDEEHCERDMGVLARSLVEPGLRGRVQRYWESALAAAQNRGNAT